MKVTYQLSENEFLRLVKFHLLQDRKKVWLIYAALFTVLVIISWPLHADISTFVSIIVFILGGILTVKFIIPLIQKKLFRKAKIISSIREMAFNDNGFSLKTDLIDVFIKYEAIEKIRKNNEFIILYLSSKSFHFLPLRVFENKSDLEKLWNLLQEKINDISCSK